MDVTYLPVAVQNGAEIRDRSFAEQIERKADGRVSGVIYRRNGREERQPCRALFLCAGAVETPRLLLMNEIGNESGQVGRNLLAHPGLQIWARFEQEIRPWIGIPGALISEDFHRVMGADYAGGFIIQSLGVMPVTYATQLVRATGLHGAELKAHMEGYRHTAGINILGECLPNPENRVELTDERDARGLPVPRIVFSAGENEKRLTAHADSVMTKILHAAGGRDLWRFDRYAHVLGTCRMGDVVDGEGNVPGIPNLFIADGSVFPSALSVNPSLTIMAVALRTADRFLERAARDGV